MNNNGYAGTYITLADARSGDVSVNAVGTPFGGIDPQLNLVVDDASMGWDVGAAATNYEHTLDLPAGTHFVRAEFNNDGGTSRVAFDQLARRQRRDDRQRATPTRNALAAADTYIENYRKGPANVALVGVAPGTQVARQAQAARVQLRHDGP